MDNSDSFARDLSVDCQTHQDQDYIKLQHLTLEKMVLTKRISRKEARKERVAALNAKALLGGHFGQKWAACQTLLAVQKVKTVVCKSQPKAQGKLSLSATPCPLLPFAAANISQNRRLTVQEKPFEIQPQVV